MSEILGNIYDRSIVIVFGTVFFSSFWRLWKLIFWQKNFQNLIFLFSFYPKNSRNGSVFGHRKLPDSSLSNAFNLLSIGLRYILSFEWPDFGPKYLVTDHLPKFKGQPPKDQPPKFKASLWNFPISETGSKCNLTCW